MKLREKIHRLVEQASENAGYDTVLSQITDDILDAFRQALPEKKGEKIGKDVMVKKYSADWGWNKCIEEIESKLNE